MEPFEAVNELGQPIYKVAVQCGHRVLTREFPRTPAGLEQAKQHLKKISELMRNFPALANK